MEKFCRTCLSSSKRLVSLKDDEGLIIKIEAISSVQISLEDSTFPITVCEDCVENINRFFCFRKIIINSDKELRERCDTLQNSFFKISKNEHNSETEENADHLECLTELEDNTDQEDVYIKAENSENTVRKKYSKRKPSKVPTCTDCNLTFLNRVKLESHRRTIHCAPGVCNICGVVVRTDNLKKHVLTHSADSVSCKICGKTLKNAESLRGHLLIHRGITYTCEICGKVSRVKGEHSRHMKTHEDPDIRKIMCTLCGKKVREIKKHILSHTGERPFMCTYCNKGFKSTYALKIHTRQHTNEKPFICEYCSMSFFQKTSLTTHLKSKHDISNSR